MSNNLILRGNIGKTIAIYNSLGERESDYERGVQLAIRILDIGFDETRDKYFTRLLFNGSPKLSIVRYELLPNQEQEKIDAMIRGHNHQRRLDVRL